VHHTLIRIHLPSQTHTRVDIDMPVRFGGRWFSHVEDLIHALNKSNSKLWNYRHAS